MSNNESVRAGFALGLNDGSLGLFMAAILLFAAVIWSAHSPHVEKTDFSLTYVGATLVHNGLAARLYDVNLQKQTRDTLFQNPSPLLFQHPPFEALLLSPLARLSFSTAYMVWGMVNALIWLGLMFALRPHLPWPGEHLGHIVLWFLFAPLGVTLYQGQSSLLVLAGYAACFLQLKRGRDFWGGLLLGIGLVKFQFVIPFALIFLFRRKWSFVQGFAVASAGFALLSVLAVGWRGALQYGGFLLKIGANPQNISYGSGVDMPTIQGLVYALAGHWLNQVALNVVVMALSVGLVGWVAWRWKSAEAPTAHLSFASAIPASLVAGSHMFTHDFSPLLLTMFLVASQIKFLPRRRLLTILIAFFWTFPVYFICVAWHCMFLMTPILLLFTWCIAKGVEELSRM